MKFPKFWKCGNFWKPWKHRNSSRNLGSAGTFWKLWKCGNNLQKPQNTSVSSETPEDHLVDILTLPLKCSIVPWHEQISSVVPEPMPLLEFQQLCLQLEHIVWLLLLLWQGCHRCGDISIEYAWFELGTVSSRIGWWQLDCHNEVLLDPFMDVLVSICSMTYSRTLVNPSNHLCRSQFWWWGLNWRWSWWCYEDWSASRCSLSKQFIRSSTLQFVDAPTALEVSEASEVLEVLEASETSEASEVSDSRSSSFSICSSWCEHLRRSPSYCSCVVAFHEVDSASEIVLDSSKMTWQLEIIVCRSRSRSLYACCP